MSSKIHQKQEAYNSFAQRAMERWGKLVEGIKDPDKRKLTAVMLENQANYVKTLTEGVMDTGTSTNNTAPFTKFVFPLIRRVWPNLIANDICSVQPMTAPVGGIFYYEIKYGNTKGRVTEGENLIQKHDAFYTSDTVKDELLAAGDGSTTYIGTAEYLPIKPGEFIVEVQDASGNVTVSGIADDSGVIAGTGVSGNVNFTTGGVTATFSSAVTSGNNIFSTYVYNMEANSNLPEIYIDIELEPIKAKSRKLKAKWSQEGAEDLQALHGVEAEADLVSVAASEIMLELDREHIHNMYTGSVVSETFDLSAIPTGTSAIDHYRNLTTALTRVANRILTTSKRGPANWLVTSPAVATYLEDLRSHGDFRPMFSPISGEATAAFEKPQEFGISKIGILSQKFTCYKDTEFPHKELAREGEILMGFKGDSWIDAGYVYAPYIPLQVTQTFLNPEDQVNVKSFRTRYAVKKVRPELFRRIKVTNVL